MTGMIRPRRSMLYMPGSNQRALEKSRRLAADALILDLEDAVAPDMKPAARDKVASAVRNGGYGRREILMRTNGLESPWGEDDLALAADLPIDGVLLPKVESSDMVHAAVNVLAANGAAEGLAIWSMIETPLGVMHAEEIASASPCLGGFVMGTSDLTKDLHAQHTINRSPMQVSLGLCLLAARAYDLTIIDGVHLDLVDEKGFAAACRQGAAMGFDGKSLIHPKQIEAANEAFAPSPGAVAKAMTIIAAYEDATAAGKGVVVVDGRLVESLHVEEAHRTVALAESIRALETSVAPE